LKSRDCGCEPAVTVTAARKAMTVLSRNMCVPCIQPRTLTSHVVLAAHAGLSTMVRRVSLPLVSVVDEPKWRSPSSGATFHRRCCDSQLCCLWRRDEHSNGLHAGRERDLLAELPLVPLGLCLNGTGCQLMLSFLSFGTKRADRPPASVKMTVPSSVLVTIQ